MIRLFRVFIPASVLALLASEVVLILSCYILAGIFVLDVDTAVFLLDDNGLARIALVVACLMLGIYFHDLYEQFRIKSRMVLFHQMCLVLGLAFLSQGALSYLHLPEWTLPARMMIWGSGLVLVFLPAWRIFYSDVGMRAFGAERVLFLGTSSLVQEIAERLAEHPELGMVAVGYVDDVEDPAAPLPGPKLVGGISGLRQAIADLKPDRIVVGMSERRQRLPVHDLLDLRFSGLKIEDALNLYEAAFNRVCTRGLRPSQLIFSAELGPRPKRVMWQGLYSLAIALVATVITLPIMVLVALVVKVSSPGPVLFRQRRVGKDDIPFTLYKFRSMYADAEAETGAVWAKKDDPRITRVGRWLRRLRLDELPQLFNVLKGEMSVVGPRPERPEFVRELSEKIPYYRQRHCVKPGITGWAQINHKYGDTLEDTIVKLEFDLYYIKNLSPGLDLYIMFHTAKVMLLSRGSQ
ncbi:MAG: sugar transferase [Acidobacteriota bacterium]|nr:sugar transferase [Acidobacteriota bacterium]